eukprot:gene5663-7819_t
METKNSNGRLPTEIEMHQTNHQFGNHEISTLNSTSVLQRNWSTREFSCLEDEESCWWGTWCCCILWARNIASFQLESSPLLLMSFLAYLRTEIRNKLNIKGTYTGDLLMYMCCSCCSVCHESREAKATNMKELDYLSGEPLEDIDMEFEQRALGNTSGTTGSISTDGSFIQHISSVSKTSKFLVGICSLISFVASVNLLLRGKGLHLVVLILVFIQPLVVLYLLYWRSRRRFATLDNVIKMFSCGFFLATTQAVFLESLLEFCITLFATMVLSIEEGGSGPQSSNPSTQGTGATSKIYSNQILMYIMQNLINVIPNSYQPYNRFDHSVTAYHYENINTNTISMVSTFNMTVTNTTSNKPFQFTQSMMRENIILVVFILFLMSFVVAAGVEETTKHFAVRCCKLSTPLKDPHAIMVYLLTSALGFATAENIEYVFGQKSSPIPGTTLFEGELFVLFIRLLMPIHLICSVLQSVNMSKVLLGQSTMNVFQILLPAILLHGTYDFVLFLSGSLEYIYEINGDLMTIVSFTLSGIITVCGLAWAYYSFTKVVSDYQNGWRRFDTEDPEVFNAVNL